MTSAIGEPCSHSPRRRRAILAAGIAAALTVRSQAVRGRVSPTTASVPPGATSSRSLRSPSSSGRWCSVATVVTRSNGSASPGSGARTSPAT
ncbi:hypothetical protein [Oerskovia merdavium]|uniref:hypothetical protein n=1 Tax=Oerskovia merdavium TaxID=2762227 RepID=UPI0021E59246|nr:hypothetical protein [Oerskovia merdavium]